MVDHEQRLIGMLERKNVDSIEHVESSLDTLFDSDHQQLTREHVALPSETCKVVAARMATLHLERLPVVDSLDKRRVIGIISRSDLIKPSKNYFEEEQQRERFIS